MNILNALIQLKLDAENALQSAAWDKRPTMREEIADLDALATQMLQRRDRHERERRRAQEHAAVWPQAQAAAENVRNLERSVKAAQERFALAHSGVELRENDLQVVLRAEPKLTRFPSDHEIKDWKAKLAACESRLETARAARRDAVAERDKIAMDLAAARETFATLERRERALQPPPAAAEGAKSWQIQRLIA